MTTGPIDLAEDVVINGVPVERALWWVDKADWGPGDWAEEPDKVQWTDRRTGLPCLAVREVDLGHWCGYAGVPEGHPAFGLDYERVADMGVSAHGGLTFGGPCREDEAELGICHVPRPGQPDRVFWFGFDCAHAWDTRPAMLALYRRLGVPEKSLRFLADPRLPTTYRTLGYVMEECGHLAERLAALAAAK